MGQYPFDPPSVAGWDWGPAWLSTNSVRARFDAGNYLLDDGALSVARTPTPATLSPRQAVARALQRRRPAVDLRRDAERCCVAGAALRRRRDRDWRDQATRADMCQRALRHLLLSGPDAQLH